MLSDKYILPLTKDKSANKTIALQSTVCAKIMEQLGHDGVESRRVVIISQDSFYRELREDEAEDAKVGNFDFDHPGETFCSVIA